MTNQQRGIANAKRHIFLLNNYKTLQSHEKDRLKKELRRLVLLTDDAANTKTAKSAASGKGVKSKMLMLHPSALPASIMGQAIKIRANLCPSASTECARFCLNSSGHGQFDETQLFRIRKTMYFLVLKAQFMKHLHREIRNAQRKAFDEEQQLAVRLNGTSDLPWEKIQVDDWGYNLYESFPDVQFYGYTARLDRLDAIDSIDNLYVNFSRKENNQSNVIAALARSYNVAAVFSKDLTLEEIAQALPIAIVDGEKDDLHYLDANSQTIYALRPKGNSFKKQANTSQFAITRETLATFAAALKEGLKQTLAA